MTAAVEHKLKTLAPYWDAIHRGEKLFEVRRDDKGFQKGDFLLLQKFDGKYYETEGFEISAPIKTLRKKITYILTGGQFGIQPGYVVLGLEP